MIRLRRLFAAWFLLIALIAPSLATAAQQATPFPDDGVYRDPAGLFTVPIPTNWSVSETDVGVAVMHDPDDELAVYLLVIEARSIDEAISLALEPIDPPFRLGESPDANQTVPSAPGVDESAIITFVSPAQTEFVQIVAQQVGSSVYCMVFTGDFEAATKRNSQIQIIASGFTISSLEALDLTDVDVAELTPELLAEFERYVEGLLVRLHVPGASVAIVANGETAYSQGFGVKDLESAEPVTADTQMMIGSTTKSMTTLMMATEVDDGLLDWDEPVVDILPEFAVADPELTKSITVRNLVCACTGVPRRDLEFVFNANELTAEDVIASLAEFEFYTGFGEAFQYSNQMVATGGYVAAAAAGGDYGDLLDAYEVAMQKRVFDPIGMTDTTLSFDAVEERDEYATPYGLSLEGEFVPISLDLESALTPVAPAGLVWSTANDMARYLITQLGEGVGPDGNRVVSAENLAETWVPQVPVAAGSSYGLGWFVEERYGIRLIHHGGNTFGFSSDLAFLPDQEIGIVVLVNGQAANLFTEGVRFRLLELLFGRPHEYDDQIEFLLEQVAGAAESLESQIESAPRVFGEDISGDYLSAELGPITLSYDGVDVVLDAGEFQTRLKLQRGTGVQGEWVLIATDPPLAGAVFTVAWNEEEDRRDVEFILGAEHYTFSATPVAGQDTDRSANEED